MTTTCIGEPISWGRLERHALAADPAVSDHLAACAVCQSCLDEIRADIVALPALPAIVARRPRSWWVWAVPAFAAAAVLALVMLRPRDRAIDSNIATIKGVGEIQLGVVRERAGAIRDDVDRFAPGDRWKVVVTCPPDHGAWIDVAVVEDGAHAADYPIAPARLACGNRVIVPGAFMLTGTRPNRVCVRIASDAAPVRRLPAAGDDDVACVTILPE